MRNILITDKTVALTTFSPSTVLSDPATYFGKAAQWGMLFDRVINNPSVAMTVGTPVNIVGTLGQAWALGYLNVEFTAPSLYNSATCTLTVAQTNITGYTVVAGVITPTTEVITSQFTFKLVLNLGLCKVTVLLLKSTRQMNSDFATAIAGTQYIASPQILSPLGTIADPGAYLLLPDQCVELTVTVSSSSIGTNLQPILTVISSSTSRYIGAAGVFTSPDTENQVGGCNSGDTASVKQLAMSTPTPGPMPSGTTSSNLNNGQS